MERRLVDLRFKGGVLAAKERNRAGLLAAAEQQINGNHQIRHVANVSNPDLSALRKKQIFHRGILLAASSSWFSSLALPDCCEKGDATSLGFLSNLGILNHEAH